MATILSIETATEVCSVAIHQSGKIVALQSLFLEKSHAGSLAVLIDQLLKNTHTAPHALDAIAVSAGPGSYTGLRIGISTAKGLCFTLEKPLISVGTLEAMAAGFQPYNLHHHRICPMLDARRMEVYCILAQSDGATLSPVEAKVIDAHSFNEELALSPITFLGNGAEKCLEVIKHENAHFINGVDTSAAHLGMLAYNKYRHGEFENLANFEPKYLKEFQSNKPIKS